MEALMCIKLVQEVPNPFFIYVVCFAHANRVKYMQKRRSVNIPLDRKIVNFLAEHQKENQNVMNKYYSACHIIVFY